MIEHTLTVPLAYSFSYLPTRRHTNAVRGIGLEYVNVTVREGGEAELPVAARYQDHTAPEGVLHFRLGPDGFYREAFASRSSGAKSVYQSSRELREMSEKGETYCNALLQGQDATSYERFRNGEAIDPNTVATIVKSDRDKAMVQLLARADQLIIIDGAVHEHFKMPVLFIERWGFFESGVSVEIGDHTKFASKPQTQVFPLDRFHDANQYSIQHFHKPVDDYSKVEILIPQAFQYDDITPATLERLGRSMRSHQKDIGYADKATAMAWYDYRNATELALTTKNETDIDAAIQSGNEYRAIARDNAYGTKDLDMAMERWDNRVMTSGLKI
jgi:hypothetical protein